MNTSPDTARNSVHRAVAGLLLGLLAANLTDGDGHGNAPLLGDDSTLSRAARLPPYPYPSGTRVR